MPCVSGLAAEGDLPSGTSGVRKAFCRRWRGRKVLGAEEEGEGQFGGVSLRVKRTHP